MVQLTSRHKNPHKGAMLYPFPGEGLTGAGEGVH